MMVFVRLVCLPITFQSQAKLFITFFFLILSTFLLIWQLLCQLDNCWHDECFIIYVSQFID